MALFWLRTSYHAQRYMFQCYMLHSLLTQSFNIVNTPIILLFSKKWVLGLAAEDNSMSTPGRRVCNMMSFRKMRLCCLCDVVTTSWSQQCWVYWDNLNHVAKVTQPSYLSGACLVNIRHLLIQVPWDALCSNDIRNSDIRLWIKSTLRVDQVCKLTHVYPEKSLRCIEVAICNNRLSNLYGRFVSDVVFCNSKVKPNHLWHWMFLLTLKVLNFWKLTSYCSLKPLWSGMGEVVPARTSLTLHPPSPPTVHQLPRLAL